MPIDSSRAAANGSAKRQRRKSTEAAELSQVKTAEGLRGATTACMQNVRGYIEQTSEQRSQAIDGAAAAIAHLHDPDIFLAEVLERAAEQVDGEAKNSPLTVPSGYGAVSFPVFEYQPSAGCLPAAG